MDKKERLLALDSMRAIAALGVVCWHYRGYFGAEPLHTVLQPFYRNGLAMVDFFFILSGFVLARAYWNDRRRYNILGNIRQRISRIYPLHFAMLICVVAIQWSSPADNPILNMLYLNNTTHKFALHLLLMQFPDSRFDVKGSFNHPSWSISTEFIVNIAFLLIIALPRKIALIIATLLAFVFIVPMNHIGIFNSYTIYGFMPGSIARTSIGFFVGSLTYVAYARYLEGRTSSHQTVTNGLFLATCAGIAFHFYTRTMDGRNSDMLVLLIGFPSLIVLALRSTRVTMCLSAKPLVFLGERSYSIYLVHFPIILISIAILGHLSSPVDTGNPIALVIFMLAVIGVASLTYRYVERPGKALLSKRKTAITPKKDPVSVAQKF